MKEDKDLQFPVWLYSKDESKLVKNKEEYKALKGDWKDSPSYFKDKKEDSKLKENKKVTLKSKSKE